MKILLFLLLFSQPCVCILRAQTDSATALAAGKNGFFVNLNARYAMYLGSRVGIYTSCPGSLCIEKEKFNRKNSLGYSASFGYEYNISPLLGFQTALNFCSESQINDYFQTTVLNSENSSLDKTIETYHSFQIPLNVIVSFKRIDYLFGFTFVTLNFHRAYYIYQDNSKQRYFKEFQLIRDIRINQAFRYRVFPTRPLFLLAAIEISPDIFRRSNSYLLFPSFGIQWNMN